MPRMLGKISLGGQDLTDFLPVKCKSELGTFTGHLTMPLHFSIDPTCRGYVLRLNDRREIGVSFSGVFGERAYFQSVGKPGMGG